MTPNDEFKAVCAASVAALAAKLAKADGPVGTDEVRAFRHVFPAELAKLAGIEDVYNDAKSSADGYGPYAHQLKHMFRQEPDVLVFVYELLWIVALADGDLHPNEQLFLKEVAKIFCLSPQKTKEVEGRHYWIPEDTSTDTIADAVTTLAAKLAKADGPVVSDEVRAFRSSLPAQFTDREGIDKVYDNAKKSADGYEAHALQLAEMLQERRRVLVHIHKILCRVALADGDLHPAEEQFLGSVANIFRLPAWEAEARPERDRWLADT